MNGRHQTPNIVLIFYEYQPGNNKFWNEVSERKFDEDLAISIKRILVKW